MRGGARVIVTDGAERAMTELFAAPPSAAWSDDRLPLELGDLCGAEVADAAAIDGDGDVGASLEEQWGAHYLGLRPPPDGWRQVLHWNSREIDGLDPSSVVFRAAPPLPPIAVAFDRARSTVDVHVSLQRWAKPACAVRAEAIDALLTAKIKAACLYQPEGVTAAALALLGLFRGAALRVDPYADPQHRCGPACALWNDFARFESPP